MTVDQQPSQPDPRAIAEQILRDNCFNGDIWLGFADRVAAATGSNPTDELLKQVSDALEEADAVLTVTWPDRSAAPVDTGSISDGYHTFDELYRFRLLYNAGLFNELAAQGRYDVHKSTRHHDGDECFGGGWFIVMATLPTGQISNHYRMADWDLFQVPARARAAKWDGHTPADVEQRLTAWLEQATPVLTETDHIAKAVIDTLLPHLRAKRETPASTVPKRWKTFQSVAELVTQHDQALNDRETLLGEIVLLQAALAADGYTWKPDVGVADQVTSVLDRLRAERDRALATLEKLRLA